VAASIRSAFDPWTVRNRLAGALALARWGKARGCAELPIAIVVPTSAGCFIVLKVIRNAVEAGRGFTRSSTRSAALFP
jgi:hypothetical protein